MTSGDCAFHHSSCCDHTGRKCEKLCGVAMKPIHGLTYRDHFDIFEKRRYQRGDTRLKYITIIVSLLAFAVSFLNVAWQIHRPAKKDVTQTSLSSEKTPETTGGAYGTPAAGAPPAHP